MGILGNVSSAIVFLGLSNGVQALVGGEDALGQRHREKDTNSPEGMRSLGGKKGSRRRTYTRRILKNNDTSDDVCTGYLDDDAIDNVECPYKRAFNANTQRKGWADKEFHGSLKTSHYSSGDRSSAASFHKTLPHNEYGEVDEDAFQALMGCIFDGTVDACEKVPKGDGDGVLINPLGGIAIDMAGPASSSVACPAVPGLHTEEFAAEMAELYWMALTRDIPFAEYGNNDVIKAAAKNLASMQGYTAMEGAPYSKSKGSVRINPKTQLFRSSFHGSENGPMVSQLLLKTFTIDSIEVEPMQTTFASGIDYMTDYESWLRIQNGGTKDSDEKVDDTKRYIRNARDLARMAFTDTVFTEAVRGALILMDQDAISRWGFNGPYTNSERQGGFVSYGTSHVMKLLGSCEGAQRASFYQKWKVHLVARPEAVAGTIHNLFEGHISNVELHDSLYENKDLLDRVKAHNIRQNSGKSTLLLPQATKEGSPVHPSYPAGHAVQNGAFATVLKAMVGESRGDECFNDPVEAASDGLSLNDYDGCLTYAGEINKLAVNIATGRQMCGVHYRMDSMEGLKLGEIVAVRILHQEVLALPENEAYDFRLFTGEIIHLDPDGTFSVDDHKCSGHIFQGVDEC